MRCGTVVRERHRRGEPSVFREAGDRSRRFWPCGPSRAVPEQSCGARWHTSRCGIARLSKTVSCPPAGIAGKPGRYILPSSSPLTFTVLLQVRFTALAAFVPLSFSKSEDQCEVRMFESTSHSDFGLGLRSSNPPLLRRPASVVRNRRYVPNGADFNAGGR